VPRPVPSISSSSHDSGAVSGVLDSSEEEPPPVFSFDPTTNRRARPPRPWLGWTFGVGGVADAASVSANQESGWSRLARYLLIGEFFLYWPYLSYFSFFIFFFVPFPFFFS
jgi:hypothetical protein